MAMGDTAAKPLILGAEQLAILLQRIGAGGRRVVAPIARDGVIALDEVEDIGDLPLGWRDEQDAGRYRARQTDDGTRFAYAAPSQPWKRYLQPERTLIVRTRRDGGGWTVELR